MKTKIFGIVTVLTLPFLLLSSIANAQEGLNCITVKAGMYFPAGDLDDIDYDTAFNGEISVGHYFRPDFCLEGGIGYFETGESYRSFDPFFYGSWSEEDNLSVIPVTLTGKGIFGDETLEFFVGCGIGLYFGSFEADFTSTATGPMSVSDDDTVFGFHFLVGMNVYANDHMFFGLEWKNIWTEEGTYAWGTPMELKADLNGYVIAGTWGFIF